MGSVEPWGDMPMSKASTWLFHLHRVSAVFQYYFLGFEFSVPKQVLKSTQNVPQLVISLKCNFCHI